MNFFKRNWRRYSAIAALALGLLTVDGQAQTLQNSSTGTIVNNSTGRIVFSCDNSALDNDATISTNITNDGRIEFENANHTFGGTTPLAADAASRVPGTVAYTGTAAGQNVITGFYTNLSMEGAAAKAIPDGVHVSELYDVLAGAGDRSYTGIFYYDGTNAQTIYAEGTGTGGTNSYSSLTLQNAGLKTLAGSAIISGASVMEASNTGGLDIQGSWNQTTGTSFTQNAAAPVTMSGSLLLGTDSSYFAGAVTMTDAASLFQTNGGGVVDFGGNVSVNLGDMHFNNGNGTVSGSLTLANSADANIIVNAGREYYISGTFANNYTDPSNMTFDVASTVEYNATSGTQTVVATSDANSYGTLRLKGAASKDVASDVYVDADFVLWDNDLAMGVNTLYMSSNTAQALYDDPDGADFEVVGRMNRTMGVAGPLTFNNAYTTVAVTSNEGDLADLTLNVQPGGNAGIPDYDAVTDVDRLVTYDYNSTVGNWVATFEYGYKQSEEPTYPAGYDNTSLRYREVTGATTEKVATGNATTGTHNGGEIFASRTLPGIQAGTTTLAQIDDPAPLFLRGDSTTFISITHGRWSNPNTWDEGVEPGSGDNVIIASGTQVHAGGTGSGSRDNYATAENVPTAMASDVLIQSDGALIFGNNINSEFAMSPNTTITVENGANTMPNVADYATFLGTAPGSFDGRGLIIYNGNADRTSLQAQNYDINGLLYNDGDVKVCD